MRKTISRLLSSAAIWILGAPPATPAAAADTPAVRKMKVHAEAVQRARSLARSREQVAWIIPEPLPGVMPEGKMAMDYAPQGVNDAYGHALLGMYAEGLGFLGFPYLAELAQRSEYRQIVTKYAEHATRKWIKLTGASEEKLAELGKLMGKFRVREVFREMAEHDGFFGRGQLFIDLGTRSDSELGIALTLTPEKLKNKLKNLKPIEPMWSYPGPYNSMDPLADDWYNPQQWYIQGKSVHQSRLLTMVSAPLPDMLKPAYAFAGLSRTQMAKAYVDNWLRNRQSGADLLHAFSVMVLSTDMSTVLADGGDGMGLLDRLDLFTTYRDNQGVFAVDKDREELTNVSAPLAGVKDLVAQSQEQMASVASIPLIELLGVTPSGLNASSDGEVRTFYANIKSFQERVFTAPLQRVIEIIQLSEMGAVDPDIGFEFVDLWETSEVDKATVEKTKADTDSAYVTMGAISNEEVRERLSGDDSSIYHGVDLSGAPPPPPDDGGDDDQGAKPGQAADAQWTPEKHPRRTDGKFGNGGGVAPSAPPPPAPQTSAAVLGILGPDGVAHLRELIADKTSTAAEVLSALSPLDTAQRDMTPTLAHDQEPDAAFWNSREYAVSGTPTDASGAVTHLVDVARHYAGSNGVRRERQARLLLGPPAAGKSTSAEEIARQGGYAIVDGDDAKKVIPEFLDGIGASAVHEESGKMSANVLSHLLDTGDNVILPLVGSTSGSIEKRIAVLKDAGYSVTVDLVDVNEDEAARRMASRALRTGRHISSGYFASIGDGPKRTYEHLKATQPDLGFGRIDGNGGPRAERYLEAVNHPTASPGKSLFGSS